MRLNNASVLPFYDSTNHQLRNRDEVFTESNFSLLCPIRELLPFQALKSTNDPIQVVWLHRLEDKTKSNVTSALIGLLSVVNSTKQYKTVLFRGLEDTSLTSAVGNYYLEIGDGVEVMYSDVFTVVDNKNELIELSYGNKHNISSSYYDVFFDELFRFKLYIPAKLGYPDYEFEQESEKRDGLEYIEKQISQKIYKFNMVAPEYLCDSMRYIRLSDFITIKQGSRSFKVFNFLMTPQWLEAGILAGVACEFNCDTIVKKIGNIK
jgi:hypothetical protein